MRNTIADPPQPYHRSILETEPFVNTRHGHSGRHCTAIQINARASDNSLNFVLLKRLRDLVFKYASNNVYYSVIWKPREDHLCTGMDLYAMYSKLHSNSKTVLKDIREYYRTTYEVAYYLSTLNKPFFTLLHGDIAGIGAGMAISTAFPLATESSRLSLPGTRYGSLGAEGGALFRFSRLPGRIGEYLMVSGKTVHSSDIVHIGLAEHFMPSDRVDLLEARLSETDTGDIPTILNGLHAFTDTPDEATIFKYIDSINRCFGKDTIEEVMTALEEETEHVEWAQNTLKSMRQNSPLAMAITLRATRLGRFLPLANCLNLEYAVMSRLVQHPEYVEGISAFVEGREPAWTYSNAKDVPSHEVDSFLAPLSIRKTLRLEKIHEDSIRIDASSEVERFLPRLGFSPPDAELSPQYGGHLAELPEVLAWAHAELLKPAGLHTYYTLLNREDELLDTVEDLEFDAQFSEVNHSTEG